MVKNKNDKRYIRSKVKMEKNLFREARQQRGMVNVKAQAIYNGARVHSTTFMRHYHNLVGMIGSVRREIRSDYNTALRRIAKHRGNFKDIVLATFTVMRKHDDYFTTAAKIENMVMFEWIGQKLWKNFRKTNYHYGMERIEQVYKQEVIGVLMAWVKEEKLNIEKAGQYAEYIMKLSENCSQRLSFLADKE